MIFIVVRLAILLVVILGVCVLFYYGGWNARGKKNKQSKGNAK